MPLLALRLDEDRLKKLNDIAEIFGGNRSAVLRKLIDASEVPTPPCLLPREAQAPGAKTTPEPEEGVGS